MLMRISRDFIHETVMSYHNSFMTDANWCKIATLAPVNDSYLIRKYQKLYALRFVPAYYFEYCVLASELRLRLKTLNIDSVNIASFGCGLSPDYYALEENLYDISFEYVGFDQAQWSTQDLMPARGGNYRFEHEYANGLEDEALEEFDVFVFPKSIKDIVDSGKDSLSDLANLIAASPKKRIFFMNSFVCTKGQRSLDAEYFDVIHDQLVNAGYVCKDDNTTTCYRKHPYTGEKFAWLISINGDFRYPDEGRILCPDKGSNSDCNVCNVIKSPILSNEFMDYQFLEYEKV
jgi:hypothetical protein